MAGEMIVEYQRYSPLKFSMVDEPPELEQAELNQLMKIEWTNILTRLWTAIGKDPDIKRLKIYSDNLQSVKYGLLFRAIDRVLRDHTYSSVPPLGTIWEAIEQEMGRKRADLYFQEALENWEPN
jgi:hypothetical protein